MTPAAPSAWTGFIFVGVVVLDLLVLASSRLRGAIRTVALQGAVLSTLPLALATGEHQVLHVVALAAGALVVKGLVIPGMMLWAMREAAIRREAEPIVGFVASLVLGAVGVVAAFTFAGTLPLPIPERHPLLVPTALATVWTGLLLVVTRRKAVAQVLGFLMVRSLAWLKPWRPHSHRYHVEQAHIDAWLGRIRDAAERDIDRKSVV